MIRLQDELDEARAKLAAEKDHSRTVREVNERLHIDCQEARAAAQASERQLLAKVTEVNRAKARIEWLEKKLAHGKRALLIRKRQIGALEDMLLDDEREFESFERGPSIEPVAMYPQPVGMIASRPRKEHIVDTEVNKR